MGSAASSGPPQMAAANANARTAAINNNVEAGGLLLKTRPPSPPPAASAGQPIPLLARIEAGEARAPRAPMLRRHSHVFAADVHTTTFLETLMHILKGNVGSGVFAMGFAVKNGGLLLAPALTLLLGFVCVHSQHILLNCAQKLKDQFGKTESPDFAETVEMCFQHGPERMRGWAKFMKWSVNLFLCITQMGFCCIYFVFISSSLQNVLAGYGHELSIQILMLCCLPFILLPSLFTSLKVLAIFSTIANVCMSTGIGVVFYYGLQDVPSLAERHWVGELHNLPLFFGTAIFAFEGIALVLPLKNSMRNERDFDRPFGVLNIGMVFVTLVFTAFGFVGYLKWGDETAGSMTLNLPKDDVLAVLVKLTVSLGMALTFPLQFFVPIQILLPSVQERFAHVKRPALVECLFRTLLVIIIFLIAEAVPKLGLFISLIGSFCSSALALAFPPIIEIIYEGTDKPLMLAKNIFIFLIALLGFATGTYESMSQIIREFSDTGLIQSDPLPLP